MRVVMTMELPVTVRREGKWFVSICPVLDVASQGASQAKAIENLGEALYLFLRSCFERGTLDQVLKESGFRPTRRSARAPKNERTLTVPLPFLVQKEHGRQWPV